MKLKYYKQLVIFFIITIIISIILLFFLTDVLFLVIGVISLYAMTCQMYFDIYKKARNNLQNFTGYKLKIFIPLILLLIISTPITIILFITNAKTFYWLVGLILYLLSLIIVVYLELEMIRINNF